MCTEVKQLLAVRVLAAGSKKWRLYKAMSGFELPNKVSGDLQASDIGEPTMEFTLEVCACIGVVMARTKLKHVACCKPCC